MAFRTPLVAFALVVASATSALAQQPTAVPGTGRIAGRVVDESERAPRAGAQVFIPGTSIRAVADDAGRYQLSNLRPGNYKVSVSMLGFGDATQEAVVRADATTVLDFNLTLSVLTLKAIVATGVTDPTIGTKAPISVGRVSAEDLTSVPTTNSALAAMQGKVAGVTITRGSGQPGDGVSIQLRTPTSVQRDNSPLFVVDGVIMSESTVDLSSLQLESMEVVKGAAAASLYGSRAANGVVTITTQRGKNVPIGKTRLTVRSEIGLSQAPTDLPVTTHHQYRVNGQGQFLDVDGNVTIDPTLRALNGIGFMDQAYGVRTYDNISAFFQPGLFNTNTLTLSSNSDATSFYVALANEDERGSLVNNDGATKNSLRVNLDHRLGSTFSMQSSVFHSRSRQDGLSGSPFFDLLLYPPDVNLGVKDSTGNFVQQPDSTVSLENPIWRQQSRDNFDKRARTLASLTTRWTPTGWLTFTGVGGYDRSDRNAQEYVPKGTPLSLTTDNPSDGSIYRDNRVTDAYNVEFQAAVNRTLFNRLNTRSSVRTILERTSGQSITAQGTDLAVVGVPSLNAALNEFVGGSASDVRSTSYIGTLALDYDGRYIAEGLIRREGSSVFGPDNRWANYGSIRGAWVLSSETWWPIEQLNEFKIRYAYGTAGNRPSFSDQYETWDITSTGPEKNSLGNRNLAPEFSTEHEMGVDLILNNRFQLELSYIDKVTKDLLFQLPLPAVTGYAIQWSNAGQQSGTTYEATLQAQIMSRPRFSWQMTMVADHSETKIDKWERSCFFSTLRNICGGASLADMWGQRFLTAKSDVPAEYRDLYDVNDDGYLVPVGAGNTFREGVAKDLWGTDVDVNGVPLRWGMPIIARDETGFTITEKIGSSLADVNFGWLNNFQYRGISLHTHVRGQLGGDIYNATRQRMYQHMRHEDLDQSGKEEDLKKPIDYYQTVYNKNDNTIAFVEDGSFLKLQELSLLYRFTESDLGRIGLGRVLPNLTLGIIGRNLYTLTGYSGFDPDVGSPLQRYDSFSYPNTRTLTANFEVAF